MMKRRYSLKELVWQISEPNATLCLSFMQSNTDRLASAWGSSHNHQAWVGGYLDHVTDVMNIAAELFPKMIRLGCLPFTLSDALFVLFLHDVEKPWRESGWTKERRADVRRELIGRFWFVLTPEQENALRYVEGEGDDYSSRSRVMNELAAFCHMCDVASARIWHSREEG